MNDAILDKSGIAITAGNISVFNYNGETREYLGTSTEFLEAGIGIAAHSCIDKPVDKKDYAIFRSADFSQWEYLPDHRGETVYSILTGEPLTITVAGDYPPDTTVKAPGSPYDKWDGSRWVTDPAARQQADIEAAQQWQQSLIAKVEQVTADWCVELMLGEISDHDKSRLAVWMAYKKAIKAVDISTAPDISWPHPPATPAS